MKIPKEYMPLWKKAREQGWNLAPTKGGHLRWTSPSGRSIFCPSTPSDHRSVENVKRKLKHAGLAL